MDASKALNISEEREEHSRGKADCPRKDKEQEKRKHDQKASNDFLQEKARTEGKQRKLQKQESVEEKHLPTLENDCEKKDSNMLQ